jgi:hypothetical protein
MRRLEIYVRKYGPVVGPKLYHALQSQAAHAGVSARLRRKIEGLANPNMRRSEAAEALPLFPDERPADGSEIATDSTTAGRLAAIGA